jgi:hypothetical protein
LWLLSAPVTMMSSGPLPVISKAIGVPSFECMSCMGKFYNKIACLVHMVENLMQLRGKVERRFGWSKPQP